MDTYRLASSHTKCAFSLTFQDTAFISWGRIKDSVVLIWENVRKPFTVRDIHGIYHGIYLCLCNHRGLVLVAAPQASRAGFQIPVWSLECIWSRRYRLDVFLASSSHSKIQLDPLLPRRLPQACTASATRRATGATTSCGTITFTGEFGIHGVPGWVM